MLRLEPTCLSLAPQEITDYEAQRRIRHEATSQATRAPTARSADQPICIRSSTLLMPLMPARRTANPLWSEAAPVETGGNDRLGLDGVSDNNENEVRTHTRPQPTAPPARYETTTAAWMPSSPVSPVILPRTRQRESDARRAGETSGNAGLDTDEPNLSFDERLAILRSTMTRSRRRQGRSSIVLAGLQAEPDEPHPDAVHSPARSRRVSADPTSEVRSRQCNTVFLSVCPIPTNQYRMHQPAAAFDSWEAVLPLRGDGTDVAADLEACDDTLTDDDAAIAAAAAAAPGTPNRRFTIYDDSIPAALQPQTPQHLPEARHRSRIDRSALTPTRIAEAGHGYRTPSRHASGTSRRLRPASPLGVMDPDRPGFSGLYGGHQNAGGI